MVGSTLVFGGAKVLQERDRCLALVRAYREQIEEGIQKQKNTLGSIILYDKNSYAIEIGDKVAKSLLQIERYIANPEPSKADGNFSLDEMAIAEQLIADQEQNPFEG